MECWQYKIKKDKERESVDNFLFINCANFQIELINYNTARDFILQYEWVGNMGTSKYCFGLYLDGILSGVVCYGPPVAPSKYRKLFGSDVSDHLFQLCRGATAFWAPKWAPSKLISSTLRYLGSKFGALAVIAYADPEAGEIGTIYQACNAIYLGMTSLGGTNKYVINGHTYDPRKVHKKFGSCSHNHILNYDPHYYTIPFHKKHRYLFITGNKFIRKVLKERIQENIKPYPKRIPSV